MNSQSGPIRRVALAFGLVCVGVAVLVLRPFLGRFRAVVVEGESMTPTLRPEDYVLVDSKAFRTRSPRRDEVVLAVDPRQTGRTLLKRVAGVSVAGIDLRGDNEALSTDSRDFGPVGPELLRGRVVLVYWPPRRAGLVR